LSSGPTSGAGSAFVDAIAISARTITTSQITEQHEHVFEFVPFQYTVQVVNGRNYRIFIGTWTSSFNTAGLKYLDVKLFKPLGDGKAEVKSVVVAKGDSSFSDKLEDAKDAGFEGDLGKCGAPSNILPMDSDTFEVVKAFADPISTLVRN